MNEIQDYIDYCKSVNALIDALIIAVRNDKIIFSAEEGYNNLDYEKYTSSGYDIVACKTNKGKDIYNINFNISLDENYIRVHYFKNYYDNIEIENSFKKLVNLFYLIKMQVYKFQISLDAVEYKQCKNIIDKLTNDLNFKSNSKQIVEKYSKVWEKLSND
jgi:hypothetical protein